MEEETKILLYIFVPTFTLIMGGIIGGFIGYYKGVRLKMVKIAPNLQIGFSRKKPWSPLTNKDEREKWFKDHPQFDENTEYDILSILPPDDIPNSLNTTYYQWFYSFPPYKEIMELERECQNPKLRYNRKKNPNGCEIWYINRDKVRDVELTKEKLNEKGKIWWIFYFRDDLPRDFHCYCTRFKYGMNWNINRSNLKHHYGWFGLCNTSRWACLGCKFKKFIRKQKYGKEV